jgi:hypothetical protein
VRAIAKDGIRKSAPVARESESLKCAKIAKKIGTVLTRRLTVSAL